MVDVVAFRPLVQSLTFVMFSSFSSFRRLGSWFLRPFVLFNLEIPVSLSRSVSNGLSEVVLSKCDDN